MEETAKEFKPGDRVMIAAFKRIYTVIEQYDCFIDPENPVQYCRLKRDDKQVTTYPIQVLRRVEG